MELAVGRFQTPTRQLVKEVRLAYDSIRLMRLTFATSSLITHEGEQWTSR